MALTTRTSTSPGTTRRTVIRSGAWAVPVLSVAAVAPAFATSGPWKLTINTQTVNASPAKTYTVDLSITAGMPSPATLTLTFTLSGGHAWATNAATAGTYPSGWTATRVSSTVITYTRSGSTTGFSNLVFKPVTQNATIATALVVSLTAS